MCSVLSASVRPTTMALLKEPLNMLKPCNGGVENDGKMRWRKEVMNHLNMFNSAPRGHVARFRWSRGARVIHAPTARVRRREARREKCKWIKQGHVAENDWLLGFLSS